MKGQWGEGSTGVWVRLQRVRSLGGRGGRLWMMGLGGCGVEDLTDS